MCVGDDPELSKRLDEALTAFNEAATGTAYGSQKGEVIKVQPDEL